MLSDLSGARVNHLKIINKHIFDSTLNSVVLYKQGLLHDFIKIFAKSTKQVLKYWVGTRSPNSGERETIGYSSGLPQKEEINIIGNIGLILREGLFLQNAYRVIL